MQLYSFILILLVYTITTSVVYIYSNSSQLDASPLHTNSYNVSYINARVIKEEDGSLPVIENSSTISSDNYIPQSNMSINYVLKESKLLVLFTSAEAGKDMKLKYDVVNHILMYSFFQRMFNFTGIIFSKSRSIQDFCKKHNIITIDHYETNNYGMPIVRDMYVQVSHFVRSRFYGYINSDIMMSSNIFDFLQVVEARVQKKEIPENLEIAGRVYETVYTKTPIISSIGSYNNYMKHCQKKVKKIRHPLSADYFIFPNSFDFSRMQDAVIGRIRIDNYLMSLVNNNKGYLIDTTFKVASYHLGTIGFRQKNFKSQANSDKYWNDRFIRRPLSGLTQARWRP